MWMLGMELGSSARGVCTLNHEPPLQRFPKHIFVWLIFLLLGIEKAILKGRFKLIRPQVMSIVLNFLETKRYQTSDIFQCCYLQSVRAGL